MTKLLIITYEMRMTAMPADYTRLADGLNSLGATRLFLSTWALRSEWTPSELLQVLCAFIEPTADHVIVVQAGTYAELNTARALGTL